MFVMFDALIDGWENVVFFAGATVKERRRFGLLTSVGFP
jgi:hypothetical protein